MQVNRAGTVLPDDFKSRVVEPRNGVIHRGASVDEWQVSDDVRRRRRWLPLCFHGRICASRAVSSFATIRQLRREHPLERLMIRRRGPSLSGRLMPPKGDADVCRGRASHPLIPGHSGRSAHPPVSRTRHDRLTT
jgi:hypothetical protein